MEQPEFALRLVAAQLHAQLQKAKAESKRRGEIRPPEADDTTALIAWQMRESQTQPITSVFENENGWDGLEALAKSEPLKFFYAVWPWLQEVFEILRALEGDDDDSLRFPITYLVDVLANEESSIRSERPIAAALKAGMDVLAESDAEAFREWLQASESENAMAAQRLLANALASQPHEYAGRALSFLLSDKRRLCLGNSEIMAVQRSVS